MTSKNKTYKAFVSSTFEDLKEHRAHVVNSLRNAGFFVDPMENWTADGDEPKKFSQDRLAGCDLCVVLVAFRRGFVPDGETRSITQIEYDTAVKEGIDILPFVLAEDAPWPRKFDELGKDPGIQIWREQLQKSHGIEPFSLDPRSIDMTGALGRWLAKKKGRPSQSKKVERIDWPEGSSLAPRLLRSKPVPLAPSDMMKVPKGPFLYGAERGREVIDHDYWIDKYPVTNEKYGKFILANGYEERAYWSSEGWKWKIENDITGPQYWNDPKWNYDNHPVVGVSYYEADAYAKWTGKRLPTEREWEKAARGEKGPEYPWGNEFDKTKCHSWNPLIGHTTPVTQYPEGVSPYGCYDMVGNVWEWCADRYVEKGEKGGRVIRGGSWPHDSMRLGSTGQWLEPEGRKKDLGFRLIQDISE